MSEIAIDYQKRPITVREYHVMAEAGIFEPRERVELIEGELIAMSPIGRDHRSAVNRLTRLMTDHFNRRAVVQVQASVILNDISEPEPDLVLLHEDPTGYAHSDPGPRDIFLVIEVGDSSRRFDRRVKLPLYARNGVPEVWLVDLVDRVVFVYRDLLDSKYVTEVSLRNGEQVACAAFPDDAIEVEEILL